MKLDQATLDSLHDEAFKRYEEARELFLESDCSESMHRMRAYETTMEFLLEFMEAE